MNHLCGLLLSIISLAVAPAAPGKTTAMIPMRDGVKLASDIYLPPGDGPFPVVVERTPYNRKDKGGTNANFVRNGYAFVIQDWRGHFDSEGKFTVELLTGTGGQEDGYDTVEWIAKQPWCNGKVGTTGASGPGIAAMQTLVSNPPHLLAAHAGVAGIHPDDREYGAGGVPSEQADRWLTSRGAKIDLWPRPRSFTFRNPQTKWPRDRSKEAVAGRIPLLDEGGWYDASCSSQLNDFAALAGKNNRLIISPKAHGAQMSGDLKYRSPRADKTSAMDWFDHWLKGEQNGVMDSEPIRYYLMGDTMDPSAPGNHWRTAQTWPVPSKPRTLYFTAQNGLRAAAPTEEEAKVTYAHEAKVTYTYDPKHPAPTIGGPNLGTNNGPQDQRKLHGRDDVVYFTTELLAQPVAITGRGSVELHISADVPDTSIMVKLIDIYPNGYEALTLDEAFMARYRDGFDHPTPMEKGKVYKLTMPLHDTALVFNKGHRIGIIITGSNSPRFEVHPNSYEPVKNYDSAPVAHVSIHASAEHASRLVLPEVQP